MDQYEETWQSWGASFALAAKSLYCKLKTHRFTLQMPACVTTCATGRVEPEVNGSSSPSAPMQNRSVIAIGKMRAVAGGAEVITTRLQFNRQR